MSTKKSMSYLKGQITKGINRAAAIEKVNVYAIQYYLDELNTAFGTFTEQYKEMSEEESAKFQSEFDDCEEKYVTASSRFRQEIDRKLNRNPEDTLNHSKTDERSLETIFERQNEIIVQMGQLAMQNKQDDLKVPFQKIPCFSGNYKDWSRFKNLFVSKVDRSTRMSDAEKLDHLLSLVSGEAASFIKNIQISNANYATAWETLCSQYDRPYLIADDILGSLWNSPPMDNKRSNIRELYSLLRETVDCLDNLGDYYKSRDPWIIHLMMKKMDKETAMAWAKRICDEDEPSVRSLLQFLKDAADSIQILHRDKFEPHSKTQVKSFSTFLGSCFVCNQDHKIFQCSRFSEMSVAEREKLVKGQSRCFNCLGSEHFTSSCQSKRTCNTCHKRHHTLLHPPGKSGKGLQNSSKNSRVGSTESVSSSSEQKGPESPGPSGSIVQANCNINLQSTPIILPTALVDFYTKDFGKTTCRVLLDTGSQASFISEDCLRRLNLVRSNVRIPVQGIASSQTYSKGIVRAVIGSKVNPEYKMSMDLHVLTKLTGCLPERTVEFSSISELRERFQLADMEFNVSSSVDLIFGVERFFDIMGTRKYHDQDNNLWIQESKLGWIISGGLPTESNFGINSHSATIACDNQQLDGWLQRFWELEEPKMDRLVNEEDAACEKTFRDTTVRLADGRYSVNLPFNEKRSHLGESYYLSLARFRSLERKFQLNPDLKKEYVKLINEFKGNGYIELVKEGELQLPVDKRFYLPHYGILRECLNKSKLRIVFDASMKSENGVSLNDILLTGPNIQTDLRDLLIKFCFCKFVASADIVKMYRQIRVNYPDREFQRIFWRENSSDPLQVFRLTTVTDGEACSPFLALRTIDQLAIDEGARFPLGAKIIKNRYMDDFFFGDDEEENLIEKRDQLVSILASAGMSLSKWASNLPSVLSSEFSQDSTNLKLIEMNDMSVVKTLGIRWQTDGDFFRFIYRNVKDRKFSKRVLLSEASRIFDPLGYVSPVVIRFKILFQETWIRKIGWDEIVPDDIRSKWIEITDSLIDLENLEIPRWMGAGTKLTIHGFSDASIKAYAAVLFTRIEDDMGNVKVRLLCSKTKLAPIKTISVARLELCGAHLLARTINGVQKLFGDYEVKYYCWCDSKIVLAWLKSHPSRWTTFVANRCSHILDLIPNVQWGYVPSGLNPADIASRGCRSSELRSSELWWRGPSWLSTNELPDVVQEVSETDLEQRRTAFFCALLTSTDVLSIVNRFSSFERLRRSVAYVLRFINNCRKKNDRRFGDLTVPEIDQSLVVVLRLIQKEVFAKDYATLVLRSPLTSTSKIRQLTPFIDSEGLIRVGGRLENSGLPYSIIHPVLLPKGHFVDILISHLHNKYYHAGATLILSMLRQRFFVTGIRGLIRANLKKCPVCQRYQGSTYTPEMGQLPPYRFTSEKAFDISGIDFAGPITVRAFRARGKIGMKSYIAVIVCMTTKAVHLELVFSLNSESLIMALKRFIARRGRCSHLHSDNGRNFVGCDRAMKETRSLLKETVENEEVRSYLLRNLISWTFIPPQSPHFGGIWEAGVKSVKYHLNRLFQGITPTVEEVNTALAEIEAILNSRPISGLTAEPDDFELVTPNHLITGFPAVQIPMLVSETRLKSIKPSNNFNNVRNIVNSFWKKWRGDYYQSLTNKYKWSSKGSAPAEGDLVLIKRNNDPPTFWARGRIIKTYPGPDEIVRVVDVKTNSGVHREMARNLIPLNLKQDASKWGEC